eukprot:338067-Pyramimonas_sp.AAC.1
MPSINLSTLVDLYCGVQLQNSRSERSALLYQINRGQEKLFIASCANHHFSISPMRAISPTEPTTPSVVPIGGASGAKSDILSKPIECILLVSYHNSTSFQNF